jgi:D-threo-aldose 1-dehydrogenase
MANQVTRPVVLGCAQLGNLYREHTDQEAFELLEEAWAGGIRSFDTAPHYGLGLSERRLGQFLRTKPRDEYTVSTKVGRLLVANDSGQSRLDDEGFIVPAAYRRAWDFSAAGVRSSLEASLERLGLDRVDTVLIHDPNEYVEDALVHAAPELERLRDAGVVGEIGVGNRDTALLSRFVRETNIDVVMVAGRFTLLDQSALDELFPVCLERSVAVLNAAIFNSGILAQPRPTSGAHFEYASPPHELVEKVISIAEVCESHWTSLPAAAIAFAQRHAVVRAIVLGADTAAQLRANLQLLSTPPSEELWADLSAHGLIRLLSSE